MTPILIKLVEYMKNIFIAILLFAVLWFAPSVIAQDDDHSVERIASSEPGMEIVQIGGGQQLFLPEGTKLRRVGAQLIIEDNAQYMAERLLALDERIKELEARENDLRDKLEELENTTKQLKSEKIVPAFKEKGRE